ncbi:MAG: hypothetical protein ACOZQL_12040 [Myxococcota bacterium]
MKKSKMQGRRPMPKMRNKKKVEVAPKTVTVGDLITAAFDALGNDPGAIVRVLSSQRLGERVGRRLVFV